MTSPTHITGDSGQRRPLLGGLPLGHWHGVEVDAHWSVFVTLGLFVTILATATLPDAHPGDSGSAYWLVAAGTAVVFFVSLLAHELAHALVARSHNMEVKGITLWMLGGVTELVTHSPNARADALVALAGPLTSLGVGAVMALLATWVGTSGLLGAALLWLASVSVMLALFNLLPGAPLDGGRLLRALLWWRDGDRERGARVAARTGRVLGCVLIGLGVLNALAGLPAGLWLALVGWFILSGASAEQAASGDAHLVGLTAADVMTPLSVVAPGWWTVDQLVAHLSPISMATGVVPLVDVAGRTVGACTFADLERVPARHRADTQLAALAARRATPLVVTPGTDATEIAAQIRSRGGVAVVEDADHPIGVVTALELSRAAHLSVLGWRTAPHRS